MICQFCKDASDFSKPELHTKCKSSTWCDCQHRVNQLRLQFAPVLIPLSDIDKKDNKEK